MSSVVKVINGEPLVGSWSLSLGFKVEHRAIKRLIEVYKSEFETIGVITTALQKPASKKGGRPVEEFLLNETQAIFLATLLTNNKEVRKFKLFLSQEFMRQRKVLMMLATQRHNAEWLSKREQGKIERKIETDTIKIFKEYAISQGSKHANTYYMSISKMQNKALFNLEFLEMRFPNIRDIVNGFGLSALQMSDHIVDQALKEGMSDKLNYKEIYLLAKQRVVNFAESLGKTPLHHFIYSSVADHYTNNKLIS